MAKSIPRVMQRQLTVSPAPIDEGQLLRERLTSDENGAVVSFLGVVRSSEEGRPLVGLEYEAFPQMVEHQFALIFDQMEERWPITSVRLTHRLGFVKAGEPSLWVEVLAPHRGEAFSAAQFLIDEMKRVVPIWKKPVWKPL